MERAGRDVTLGKAVLKNLTQIDDVPAVLSEPSDGDRLESPVRHESMPTTDWGHGKGNDETDRRRSRNPVRAGT
jgi:hypothetical protein